jgi:hypothetical protein
MVRSTVFFNWRNLLEKVHATQYGRRGLIGNSGGHLAWQAFDRPSAVRSAILDVACRRDYRFHEEKVSGR